MPGFHSHKLTNVNLKNIPAHLTLQAFSVTKLFPFPPQPPNWNCSHAWETAL